MRLLRKCTQGVLALAVAAAGTVVGSSGVGASTMPAKVSNQYGIGLHKDVPITMRDGVVLRADVRYPTDPSTGLPAQRAATRQAGVSHNAAYRHFANQEDLLAAVADRCLNKLGMLMIERADRVRFRDPARRAKARLNAIGRAYIEFARTEPGWFRAAFTSARPHDAPVRPGQTPLSDGSMPAPTNPFAVLNARLDELVVAGALRPQRRQGAEFAAWSGVHGLSSLLLDGPLRELPEPAVEQAIDVVLAAIERGLR